MLVIILLFRELHGDDLDEFVISQCSLNGQINHTQMKYTDSYGPGS